MREATYRKQVSPDAVECFADEAEQMSFSSFASFDLILLLSSVDAVLLLYMNTFF